MLPLPDLTNLGLFVLAALVLLLTPGPAVLYIVARSIDQGRRAGLVSMLGVHAGTLVHVAAAAAGLSAVLAASATAFSAVKLLGAAYLVYLGLRKTLERTGPAAGTAGIASTWRSRAIPSGNLRASSATARRGGARRRIVRCRPRPPRGHRPAPG